jgi:hypothetical protein
MTRDADIERDERSDLSTMTSHSGIHQLNIYGQAVLRRILPTPGEPAREWAVRLHSVIPQVQFGSPLTTSILLEIEKHTGHSIPVTLVDIWRAAPGVVINGDSFLWSPQTFLQKNHFFEQFFPELFQSWLFFGGFDGLHGAISRKDSEDAAYCWSREENLTGQKCASIAVFVSEYIAWYVTSFQPLCFDGGYVPR